MIAGRMRHRVTVLRRAVVAGNPDGNARADFVTAFTTRAALMQKSGVKRLEAGLYQDQGAAVMRVYSNENTRSITIADRLLIEGPGLAVATHATISVVIDATHFECAGLDAFAAGVFDGARLQFAWQDGGYASAENAGDILAIQGFTAAGATRTIALANTPDTPIAVGDDFRIFARGAEWSIEGVALPDAARRSIDIDVSQHLGG